MSHENGTLRTHLQKIEGSLDDIRDDLANAVRELTRAVDGLTDRISTLAEMWEKSVPIKVVALMFFVLVLAMVGVEGAQWLFAQYLKVP